MAMKQETLLVIGVIIFAVVFLGKTPADTTNGVTPTTNGGIDLCKLVESEISFSGQRMFLASTALTTEWARVIKINGDNTVKDKGQISLDGGTTDTTPKAVYNIYLGENSTTYYTQPKSYTAPCSDATDDVLGILCTIDTTPTVTVFDEYGRPNSDGTNTQAIATGEDIEVSVQVKVSADECFGNPNAAKKNAICFGYNTTIFESVKVVGGTSIATPYAVATAAATDVAGTGQIYECFELNLLKDTERTTVDVAIDTVSDVDPGAANNISITINDMGFDLDADTLDEIWDFEDEDNNELGISTITAASWLDIS